MRSWPYYFVATGELNMHPRPHFMSRKEADMECKIEYDRMIAYHSTLSFYTEKGTIDECDYRMLLPARLDGFGMLQAPVREVQAPDRKDPWS